MFMALEDHSQEWLWYMSYYERNLPHWHPEGRTIFLTWRLRGSLPRSFVRDLERLKEEPGKQFLAADQQLDAGTAGPRWLSDPEIAGYVVDSLIRGAELGHYSVHAYVVMSNHVHILLDPRVPLRRITGGIKGVSARDANAKLGRTGKPFWQDESFDHWIRNEAQFERVQTYIERNPVKAGLVARAEDWKWSSANRVAQALLLVSVVRGS
jgi:putative transposase